MPNLDGKVNWARDGERLADDLKRRIGQLGYPTDVVVERSFDPLDWEAMGLERGTPWSLSHTLFQSGPFRPGNVDRACAGLGVRRFVDRARLGRSDGAALGQARRANASRSTPSATSIVRW